MPAYNLSEQEVQILTTWLYEPHGYLDQAVSQLNVSARQALANDPALDVTAWIRTNARGVGTLESDWDECAMAWWLLAHDGQDITPQLRPPEASRWRAILEGWDASISRAFQRLGRPMRNQLRNQHATDLYDRQSERVGTLAGGDHLALQQLMARKATPVLGP